jgi:hypothetical protein
MLCFIYTKKLRESYSGFSGPGRHGARRRASVVSVTTTQRFMATPLWVVRIWSARVLFRLNGNPIFFKEKITPP